MEYLDPGFSPPATVASDCSLTPNAALSGATRRLRSVRAPLLDPSSLRMIFPPHCGSLGVFPHPLSITLSPSHSFANCPSFHPFLSLLLNVPSISCQEADWYNVFILPGTRSCMRNSPSAVFSDKGDSYPKF